MKTLILAALLFVSASHSAYGQTADIKEVQPSRDVVISETTSIDKATRQLNEITSLHPIGKDQPPLKSSEVVGAINRWLPSATDLTPELYDKFAKIAAGGELPGGSKLHFSTKLTDRNMSYTVWWLDLQVDNYNFRIRDRTISSKALTEAQQEARRRRLERLKKMSKRNTSLSG